SNEVARVGRVAHLVQIVYAPDQPSLDVAPGAEILDVQVADRSDGRGIGHGPADSGPLLYPTIEGTAEEDEGTLLQPFMFSDQIRTDDARLRGELLFVQISS